MQYCEIQEADAVRVFKSMKTISTLKRLNIYHSICADQAANAIAEVLANNKQLKYVNLVNNDLSPSGALQIFNENKYFKLDKIRHFL